MDFVGAIKAGFKNYVNFRGTATRPEYWYWILFTGLIGIVLAALDSSGSTSTIASLAFLLPSLGVAVRRLRDAGFSWLWLLLPAAGIPSFAIGFFQFVNELILSGVSLEDLENPELIDPEVLNSLMNSQTLWSSLLLIFASLIYILITSLVVQVIMPARKTKSFEEGNKRVAPKGPETPAL
jgi:uncharacterized membrane protein YhaH (DUF805 family)